MMNLPYGAGRLLQSSTESVTRPADPDGTGKHALRTIRFGEVIAPLKAAFGEGHEWPNDFCNDDVLLSNDLFEVLQAFAQMQAQKTPG
jgi:hypothetical protein